MYQGCPMVEDIDGFLDDFGLYRAETNWVGGSWGDGLYVRKAAANE
ncbi:MAG: hypothetical protein P8M78_07775 [Myxococcota bacterium]|nr:hypothetical protein [Myxococcota bacterium]